jgi:hypothetical protein
MHKADRREATGCPVCGGVMWWRSRTGARVCAGCFPDPLDALDALTRATQGTLAPAPRAPETLPHRCIPPCAHVACQPQSGH